MLAGCSTDSTGLASDPSLNGTAASRLATAPSLDAITASAATIRVTCVKRGTRRSTISVDGNNLAPGTYRARVTSPLGTHRVTSAPRAAVGDEASFDFASNPADIAAGATPIAPNYITIVNGAADVRGQILNSAGAVVVAAAVNCTVR
jgi:hypothetical protein